MTMDILSTLTGNIHRTGVLCVCVCVCVCVKVFHASSELLQ